MRALITMVVALVAAYSGLIPLQRHIDGWKDNTKASDEILYIPTGQYLKAAVLGYDNVVADVLWFRGIVLFGDKFKRDPDETWFDFLERIVEVATDLDPKDHRIYMYGGIMLNLSPRYEEKAIELFKRGTEQTNNYFLPFAVGMHAIEVGDKATAAKYLTIASQRPDAPFYTRSLAATVLTESKQKESALAFLEEQLKYLQPDSMEYRAVKEKILEVTYEIYREGLESARSRFQSTFGRDPDPLTEMLGVSMGNNGLPPDPYRGKWVVDPESGRIKSSKEPISPLVKAQEEEAKKAAQQGDGPGQTQPVAEGPAHPEPPAQPDAEIEGPAMPAPPGSAAQGAAPQ